jgi:hypothetical protein
MRIHLFCLFVFTSMLYIFDIYQMIQLNFRFIVNFFPFSSEYLDIMFIDSVRSIFELDNETNYGEYKPDVEIRPLFDAPPDRPGLVFLLRKEFLHSGNQRSDKLRFVASTVSFRLLFILLHFNNTHTTRCN